MLSWQTVTLAQQPMLCGYATRESGLVVDSFDAKRNEQIHPARWRSA